MDTRIKLKALADYNSFYGIEKSKEDAATFIKEIPSIKILNLISRFSAIYYLSERGEERIDERLTQYLRNISGAELENSWNSVVKEFDEKGLDLMFVYGYSNLLFYDLIFENFNYKSPQTLSPKDAKNIFDAYLIMNSINNKRIDIKEGEIDKNSRSEYIDKIMSKVIYQKDYASSTDYENQVVRGKMLFEYLENSAEYGQYILGYYKKLGVKGWKDIFKTLFVVFTDIMGSAISVMGKNHIIDVAPAIKFDGINPGYLQNLSINPKIDQYAPDKSFGTLRNNMIFHIADTRYFILDVNFFIDQFYKGQVFGFNNYLKENKIKNDFLSIKAKDFMEDMYFRHVSEYCFQNVLKYFGNSAINSKGEELCDLYLRENEKICLIELKDVLLNADVKNIGDTQALLDALDDKFLVDQKKRKKKGISQLLNAVSDLNNNGASFDVGIEEKKIELYPVVMYTDNTFGIEGVNKIYRDKFNEGLAKIENLKVVVREVIFLNLSFFEYWQEELHERKINLFELFDEYVIHCKILNQELTPFEVFARMYLKEKLNGKYKPVSEFSKIVADIITPLDIK